MQNSNILTGPGQVLDSRNTTSNAYSGTRTVYLGIADFVRVIRRRRWIIFPVVAIAMLLAIVLLARTMPVYTATTSVMVLPTHELAPLNAPTTSPSASEDAMIQTKVELLESRSLARRTAESLRLEDDPEFAPAEHGRGLANRFFAFLTPSPPVDLDPGELAKAAERAKAEAITDKLIAHVKVVRVARSNVIDISASSVDPVKAARIANRLVETYMRGQIDDANESRKDEIQALSARVADVRAYLQTADSTAASYRRQHGLLSSQPESQGNAKVTQLAGLLTQAQAESASEARKATPLMLPGGEISASSPLLTDLMQQETIVARKMGQLTSIYGAGYPEVAQTTAELAALRGRIAQEKTRLRADLAVQSAASQARSAQIDAAIGGMRSQAFSEGQLAVPLRALERKVDAVNTLYTTLLNQLNAKIGSSPDVKPDISRISRAPVPDSPSYPLPAQVMAITLIAALALGILLAFMVETMDTKLRTAEQVQRLLGIPTLAMIPEQEGTGPVHDTVADQPRSRFAEAMRNLLIEIESRIDREGGRVIVITSPLEGEGKNTVATSLTAAAAVVGRKVVVVDFDLRRPKIISLRTPEATGEAGVVDFLSQRAAVDDLVAIGQDRRFPVIGVGELAADPGALIASPRLPQLLSQLRERFELVILNAPPILPVRDAKTLSAYADAAVLVLRWGHTRPEAAAVAMEIFGLPIIGAVLNRVDLADHANRAYGDAIHHIAKSTDYYDADLQPRRWSGLSQFALWYRKTVDRTARALHLA